MGDKRYRVGGTRGGQDQFKWEDVKSDVHRENYLGHSLLAPVGRWQRGKDLKWWNKRGEEGGADAARAQADMEKARVKQLDEDLLNEALGLAPKTVRAPQADLSAAETKRLLEKGATMERDGANTERVSGLGAGPAKHHEHIPSLTLKEKELERLQRERELKEGGLTEASLVEIVDYEKEQRDLAVAATAGAGAGASRKRMREEQRAKKREKKDKKRAKKSKKKEKKRLKKAKKAEQESLAGVFSRGDGGVDERSRRPVEQRPRSLDEQQPRSRPEQQPRNRPEQQPRNRPKQQPRSRDESRENRSAMNRDEASTRDASERERRSHNHGRDDSRDNYHRRDRSWEGHLHTGGANGNLREHTGRDWKSNGEDRRAVDRGRGEAHGREQAHGRERESRLPAKRQRSRNPFATSEIATQRREEGWGAWDSRNDRGRQGRDSRGLEESHETWGRPHRDEGRWKPGEGHARRLRSASRSSRGRSSSSSSSSSSNSSSSSGSGGEGGATSGRKGAKSDASKSRSRSRSRSRSCDSRRRSCGNLSGTRDPLRDARRNAPGAWCSSKENARGTRHTRSRSRSRSMGRRPVNRGDRKSGSHGDHSGSSRRGNEDRRGGQGRN